MMSSARLNRTFAPIEAAAAAGARCPLNKPFGPIEPAVLAELYRRRWIRTEVFRSNFRQVTILAGPHAGKATAPPPWPATPYRIVGGVLPGGPRP